MNGLPSGIDIPGMDICEWSVVCASAEMPSSKTAQNIFNRTDWDKPFFSGKRLEMKMDHARERHTQVLRRLGRTLDSQSEVSWGRTAIYGGNEFGLHSSRRNKCDKSSRS